MPREESAKNAAGWEICLENLETRLAGRAAGEQPEADWSELHEHYASRFDVDPEIGRRAIREHEQSA